MNAFVKQKYGKFIHIYDRKSFEIAHYNYNWVNDLLVCQCRGTVITRKIVWLCFVRLHRTKHNRINPDFRLCQNREKIRQYFLAAKGWEQCPLSSIL